MRKNVENSKKGIFIVASVDKLEYFTWSYTKKISPAALQFFFKTIILGVKGHLCLIPLSFLAEIEMETEMKIVFVMALFEKLGYFVWFYI